MTGPRLIGALIAALVALTLARPSAARVTSAPTPSVSLAGSTVAVIGDYGVDTTAEANVASLVASWGPAAIVTVGDNYYTSGGSGTGKYDLVVGKYYCAYLKGAASGTNCAGGTADVNRFFPATGNHDYSDGLIANYTAYFALPGTELVYSQVVGDVEFFFIDSEACLSSSTELDAEKSWLQSAMGSSSAAWQVVVFHHPPFNVGAEHYDVQHMRVLAPLFERQGVDLVLSGHEHNYQRPRPLRFAPAGPGQSAVVGGKSRLVPGTFTVDRLFNGVTRTTPQGVLYIVTGAGGKHLYDPGYTDNPARWVHPEDNSVDYVVKMVTDRHSLTVIDVDGRRLTMTQVDETGEEFDRIAVTKPAGPAGTLG